MNDLRVSLITSLYRAEKHLPQFIHHADKITGLNVEFILIANDATPQERRLIENFAGQNTRVNPVFVPRETLYASWNRGVQLASGQCIGFWNVDDVRTAEGLLDGCQRIANGCQLVYFPYTVLRPNAIMPYHRRRVYEAAPYDADSHRRMMKCGPFFLFTPQLYEQVGAFDEHFRIVGDSEWCARATYHTDFCPSPVHGGYFYLHGGNLSSTGNPLQIAEENVLFILHELWDEIKPVDPDLMRETWAKWHDRPLPADIEEKLWGSHARSRWEQWRQTTHRQRRRAELEQAMRFIPKTIVDSLGLRSYLSKFGFVKERRK